MMTTSLERVFLAMYNKCHIDNFCKNVKKKGKQKDEIKANDKINRYFVFFFRTEITKEKILK